VSVNALLACAAAQSTCGGIIWYGGSSTYGTPAIKVIQGLAKDTFDSFNNGFTFICGP
jgi:hypothetical protein